MSIFSRFNPLSQKARASPTAPDAATPASGTASAPNTATADFAIDEYRPMKVVCIGAGYAGIVAGIRFRQRMPEAELTIYEKESGVGGTWHVNRYPGLACDIPSHSYQLTFEPNTEWSGFYAPGPEIRAYLQRVVDKWKLAKYIKFRHEFIGARWDDTVAKWRIRIRRCALGNPQEVEEIDDLADVLFLGVGALNRWKWPNLGGLDAFGGKLVHTAQFSDGEWEEVVADWSDKAVGVIGNGSSGIQTVAALQPKVKTLTNFARQKTWLAVSFSVSEMLKLSGRGPESEDYSFTDEQRAKFKDPEYYRKFRRAVEHDINSVAEATLKDSPLQKAAREAFTNEMRRKLARKPELLEKILPQFSVCCRRLTPGPGYLEALCEDNATLETTHIARVTPTGVDLADGRSVPLDIIVCATGFNTTYHYPFDVIGRNGLKLNDRWTPHAEAYLALAVDGFPNLFWGLGPNSGVNSGSLLVVLEKQVDYAVAAALKLQRERLATIEVKREAVLAWRAYMERHWPKTVFTDDCNSWYRMKDGWIVGLWPGTCLHAVRTLSHPRWEDFNYTPLEEDQSLLHWLGDGQTHNEKTMTGDRAWYLDDIDFPHIPTD